jgi:hypothetical protein
MHFPPHRLINSGQPSERWALGGRCDVRSENKFIPMNYIAFHQWCPLTEYFTHLRFNAGWKRGGTIYSWRHVTHKHTGTEFIQPRIQLIQFRHYIRDSHGVVSLILVPINAHQTNSLTVGKFIQVWTVLWFRLAIHWKLENCLSLIA